MPNYKVTVIASKAIGSTGRPIESITAYVVASDPASVLAIARAASIALFDSAETSIDIEEQPA